MVYIQIYARMLVDAISSTILEVLPFKFRLREMFFLVACGCVHGDGNSFSSWHCFGNSFSAFEFVGDGYDVFLTFGRPGVHLYRIRDDLYKKPLTRIVILFDYIFESMLSTTSQKEEVMIKSCVNGN